MAWLWLSSVFSLTVSPQYSAVCSTKLFRSVFRLQWSPCQTSGCHTSWTESHLLPSTVYGNILWSKFFSPPLICKSVTDDMWSRKWQRWTLIMEKGSRCSEVLEAAGGLLDFFFFLIYIWIKICCSLTPLPPAERHIMYITLTYYIYKYILFLSFILRFKLLFFF